MIAIENLHNCEKHLSAVQKGGTQCKWRARPALLLTSCLLLLVVFLLSCHSAMGGELKTYQQRGFFELALKADMDLDNPYLDVEFQVVFTRPNNSQVTVDGFYDGEKTYKARAYCDTVGQWRWRSSSNNKGLAGKKGKFKVVPSNQKGKLRQHPQDPRQFAYDNGEWFLHIGDTGYRYVTRSEPKWKEYIDQAARMGATKIRTWFCQARSDVQILFTKNRKELNLGYWQEIDRRLLYALKKHPQVIIKLIPYGEDVQEVRRYDSGDKMSKLIARYAQARFSALPNIYWCVSNDFKIVVKGKLKGRKIYRKTINKIGRDMAAHEPWGTLLTNHQWRRSGYDFVDEPWSDVITLEDKDQVDGRIFPEYRNKGNDPIVLDEDRYENYINPRHSRYYFRRLMWAGLLSGGHVTYGGLKTYEPYDGELRGVQGYYDAVRDGKLEHGADDFIYIHKFFNDTGLTLVNMRPDDALVGNTPAKYKCIHNKDNYIVYLANPDGSKPSEADVSEKVPAVTVQLPDGIFSVRWYNPRNGQWTDKSSVRDGSQTLTAPGGKDWILLLQRRE